MKTHTYLNFAGQTEEAFQFYAKAFGGEPEFTRYSDMPMDGVALPEGDAAKIMHAQLDLGDGAVLMGSDPLAAFGHTVTMGNNAHISVQCDSKEQADALYAALGEGGETLMPPAQQPWGTYWGNWKDRFGVYWMVNFAPEQA
ncbi:MAG: VOC family protein [Thermoplasmatota archaeon]